MANSNNGNDSNTNNNSSSTHSLTLIASYAGTTTDEEKDKGTLEAGKLADLVMIDRDLTTIPPETIRDAKVVLTVVGGKAVFDRQPDGAR